MNKYLTPVRRVFAAAVLIGAVGSLTGCGSMSEMAKQQQEYNRQQCQNFGLRPGSNAYVQCINDGADAYAKSHPSTANSQPTVVVSPRNNSCSAPVSTPQGSCAACSVSCGTDKHAACQQGQEWPGGSPTCMHNAVCECQ